MWSSNYNHKPYHGVWLMSMGGYPGGGGMDLGRGRGRVVGGGGWRPRLPPATSHGWPSGLPTPTPLSIFIFHFQTIYGRYASRPLSPFSCVPAQCLTRWYIKIYRPLETPRPSRLWQPGRVSFVNGSDEYRSTIHALWQGTYSIPSYGPAVNAIRPSVSSF